MHTLHDAAAQLRNERVNVQLEFVLTENGDTLFNARATYWRGSEHSDRMYLVAQHTADEAIMALADAMDDRAWVKVDWRARLYSVGVYGHRPVDRSRNPDMGPSGNEPTPLYPYTRT